MVPVGGRDGWGRKESPMKSGKCPKCGKQTVFMKRDGIYFAGGGVYVFSTDWGAGKPVKEVDQYLCASCGYFESYIEDKAKLEKVVKDWKKV